MAKELHNKDLIIQLDSSHTNTLSIVIINVKLFVYYLTLYQLLIEQQLMQDHIT